MKVVKVYVKGNGCHSFYRIKGGCGDGEAFMAYHMQNELWVFSPSAEGGSSLLPMLLVSS